MRRGIAMLVSVMMLTVGACSTDDLPDDDTDTTIDTTIEAPIDDLDTESTDDGVD